MSDDKAIEKREEKELVLLDYGEDANEGFEGQTQDDLAIPFLALLQDLSPQVTDGTIPNAKAGLLFNTVTEELLGESVEFIPGLRQRCFVEWVPRKQGGGFVARHEVDSPIVKEAIGASKTFGKYTNPETGNDLVETIYLYGVLCPPDGDTYPIVIAFTSTKIGVFRKWNTKVNMLTIQVGDRKQRPPRYAHRVRVRSTRQTNRAKQSFYNFVLEPAETDMRSSLLRPDDPRFLAAKKVREMVLSGAARAADETQAGAGGGDDDDGDGVF